MWGPKVALGQIQRCIVGLPIYEFLLLPENNYMSDSQCLGVPATQNFPLSPAVLSVGPNSRTGTQTKSLTKWTGENIVIEFAHYIYDANYFLNERHLTLDRSWAHAICLLQVLRS